MNQEEFEFKQILNCSKISPADAKIVSEGAIFNGCLFLFKTDYPDDAFSKRSDFSFVVAPNLLRASPRMFLGCQSVELVFAPAVTEIGEMAFSQTKL